MTWWRQSRDASGKTIAERLERIVALVEDQIEPGEGKWGDNAEWGLDMALKLQHETHGVKRIRSILRRLKICPRCKWGVVLSVRRMPSGQVEGFGRMRCPVCDGSGAV